jgi:rRNA maturation endonuclease Nob1
MAALEMWCTSQLCDWLEFANKRLDVCPRCGGKILIAFDEIETGGENADNND